MRFRKFKLGSIEVLFCTSDQLFGLRRRSAASRDGARETDEPQHVDEEPGSSELRRRVEKLDWYHSIELANGLVTPGLFDHRSHLHHYPIPARLDGQRVLDVATFDGFWAFEMEKRGAREVVAIDVEDFDSIDLPPSVRLSMPREALRKKLGGGFELCHQALESRVERKVLSVYDLSPDRVGQFDFVFMSDLLLHLVNPVRALQNVCSVTAGEAVIVDVFNPMLPGRLISYEGGIDHCTWWIMSYEGLRQMVADAGFRSVESVSRFSLPFRGSKTPIWRAALRARP